MSKRVLFVDDEPQVLEGIQRSLRKQIDLHTATSGAAGLRLLDDLGPFALIISDMRMPGMDGAQFLAKVREIAPDTVRMILSGQSDLQATIAAVNEGHIYRFLNKPCPTEHLLAAIEDGLNQYRLLNAEKVLLEQTLSGCVTMLIEILGMVSPFASNRASRLKEYTVALAAVLELPDRWQWGLAAFISQIGCVGLPKELMIKVEAGQTLTPEERRLYEAHPEVAAKLLEAIPRMEEVSQIVGAQFGPMSFAGKPDDLREWDVCSAGQMLLRTAIEFDREISNGSSGEIAIDSLRQSPIKFPTKILTALQGVAPVSQKRMVRQVRVKELIAGMVLEQDLISLKGIRLVPAGQQVTHSLMVRLTSIAGGVGVVEPFRVLVSS